MIKHIKMEIRNILKSKFLFIIAILIIAVGVVVPVLSNFSGRDGGGGSVIEPTVRPRGNDAGEISINKDIDIKRPEPDPGNQQSITVDGVTIYSDNPFFWNLRSLQDEKIVLERDPGKFSYPASIDLMLELIDREISYFLIFAQHITTWQDYRAELAWSGTELVYDLFFLSKSHIALEILSEVAMYRKGLDPNFLRSKYIDLNAVERLAAIDAAEEKLADLNDIVANNNFPKFIAMRILQARDQINAIRENIAIQEKAIIDNPSQEATLSAYIDQLKREINIIETSTIPLLEFRLEKNIIPGLPIWQNNAINDISNSRSQLSYMIIMTEEEYNNSRGGGTDKRDAYSAQYSSSYFYPGEYNTYAEYVAYMQRQIDTLNLTIIVAQKSLDSGTPDMKYVPMGSRNRTVGFLDYSMIVSLFGVLLGGWLIASEYQQGTIRLLMIRPRTRTRILMAKFAAALVVWLAVDVLSSLANFVTNGIVFGFTDFTYPNFTVDGQISFLAYYLPRFLACILPILFSFTMAFMLSVLVKNIAVAIAIPIVLYIASIIIMNVAIFSPNMNWVAWTPFPFLQMSMLLSPNSPIQYLIQRGVNISIPFGIVLLLIMSISFTATSIAVFKKRDIVN